MTASCLDKSLKLRCMQRPAFVRLSLSGRYNILLFWLNLLNSIRSPKQRIEEEWEQKKKKKEANLLD